MNVSPINNQEVKPTFNAAIKPNKIWNNYINYLQSHSVPRGIYSDYTKKNLDLIKKIEEAIKQHPSDAELDFSAMKIQRTGGLFQTGIVESKFDKIIDVEPARDDSGTALIENLLRKLLNPKNKVLFNKLMGIEHRGIYGEWWNKNIKPIWDDIVEVFREETCEASSKHKSWDKIMNIEFRERNSEITQPLPKSKFDNIVNYFMRLFIID